MAKPKKISRAKARAQQAELCAHTKLQNTYDLCVIGGGAAGLVAAIRAGEKGLSVLILEKEVECGKKILATGNGRCNFTNEHLNSSFYSNSLFVEKVMPKKPLNEILSFFSDSHLMWTKEANLYYPRSLQSSSVRDLLVIRAQKAKVDMGCARFVKDIKDTGSNYKVIFEEDFSNHRIKTIDAKQVIVSVGGQEEFPFKSLNLKQTPTRPCLCAIETSKKPSDKVDGKRISCKATLIRDNKEVASQTGEVMFRKYGLSGIAIFNLSRHVLPQDKIVLSMFYGKESENLRQYLTQITDTKTLLYGMVDKRVADEIYRQSKGDIDKIYTMLTCLEYTVSDLANTKAAQVTKGGVALSSINPSTLEVYGHKGLYLVGEVLDIDADCGGFNLSWAWISGLKAADSCIKSLKG